MNAPALINDHSTRSLDRLATLEAHADLRRILHYEPLIDGIDPLIGEGAGTFTRSSIATLTTDAGLVVSKAADEHRIQDLGLLFEPARSNYVTRSIVTGGNWIGQGTLTDAFSTAPDGTATAAKWAFTPTVSGTQARYRSMSAPSVSSGATIRFGFYQRNATVASGRIRLSGSGGIVYILSYSTNQTSTWQWMEFAVPAAVSGTVTSFSFEQQVDHGDGEFELWGIDFAGDVPLMGSHIPTAGSSVARAADDLTIPLTSAVPDEGLTVYLKLVPMKCISGLSEQGISLGSVASSPYLNLFENYGTDTVRFEYHDGTSPVVKDHSGEAFNAEVEWTAQIQSTSFKSFKGDAEQTPAATVLNPSGGSWNGNVLRIHNIAAVVKAVIVSSGARTPADMRRYLRV